MIAANSVSSGVSCIPLPCGCTFGSGISGSAISYSPSGTIQLHVPRPREPAPHRTRSTLASPAGRGLSGSQYWQTQVCDDYPAFRGLPTQTSRGRLGSPSDK